MKALFASLVLLAVVPGAHAALAVGAPAPDFSTQAALAGKEFNFSLREALKKGPVVLYFYPKAFTQTCTIEAHDFSDASPQFTKLGATVLGVSHDDIATLKDFSVKDCRNQFAVAADPAGTVIKAYDDVWAAHPPLAARTTYVIAPGNKVLLSYSDDGNPDKHVSEALAAVEKWRAANP